jgi:hypothetical protein
LLLKTRKSNAFFGFAVFLSRSAIILRLVCEEKVEKGMKTGFVE